MPNLLHSESPQRVRERQGNSVVSGLADATALIWASIKIGVTLVLLADYSLHVGFGVAIRTVRVEGL